jgi:hypothetical protein
MLYNSNMNEYDVKVKQLSEDEQKMFVELIMSAYDNFVIDEETKNLLLKSIDTSFDVFF